MLVEIIHHAYRYIFVYFNFGYIIHCATLPHSQLTRVISHQKCLLKVDMVD